MEHAELFLGALDRKAKPFAASARATFEGEQGTLLVVVESVGTLGGGSLRGKGIRRCSVRVCEVLLRRGSRPEGLRACGQYTPEGMPEIMSGVYEDEGYAVPYMWAAILIYALWPSMIKHIACSEMSS